MVMYKNWATLTDASDYVTEYYASKFLVTMAHYDTACLSAFMISNESGLNQQSVTIIHNHQMWSS